MDSKKIGEQTYFSKLVPNWFKNMALKTKIITIMLILVFSSAVAVIAYNFFLNIVLQYKWHIIFITLTGVLLYMFTKTNAFPKLLVWIFVKDKNKKIFFLMIVFTMGHYSYNPLGVLGSFVDIFYIYLMIALYLFMFSQKTIFRYIKHFIALISFLIFRAMFQESISSTIEHLLNFLVLGLVLFMLLIFFYELIFVKKEDKKKRVNLILHSILLITLVISPFVVNPMSSKKRMETINFIPINTLSDTYNEIPIDAELAKIFMTHKLTANTGVIEPDFVLDKNLEPVYMADVISTHPFDLYIPFIQKSTKEVKILSMKNWKMEIKPVKNHSIYSDGFMYGHNTHTAVAKRFNPLSYVSDSAENTIKFQDSNGSFYSVELVSTLSDYFTPYMIPKGLYVIPDENQKFNFLLGDGDYVSLENAVDKYPFLKDQPIVALNTIRQIGKSIKYVNGYGDVAFKKGLFVPDTDKYGNMIVERLYTTINGKSGPYAKIEFKAQTVTVESKNDDGERNTIKQVGTDVLETWFIPLFYNDTEGLTVYKYDNNINNYTYLSKSNLASSLLDERHSTGYEVFGKTTVIRNGQTFVIASRVKLDNGVYSKTPNYVLYSFITNTLHSITSPVDMEKVIKTELAQLKK